MKRNRKKLGEFATREQKIEVIRHIKSMNSDSVEMIREWSHYKAHMNIVASIKSIKKYLMDQFDISEEDLR
ncbi:MAG: hypothetical protein ABEI74_02900 [Candidatus Pacearchaeota archaeon]